MSYNDFKVDIEKLERDFPYALHKTGNAKKTKTDPDWKTDHERLFSEARYEWPPADPPSGFRDREAELVWYCDKKFPAEGDGWDFFDSNHSAERTLKPGSDKSPWKSTIPT
eukprot:4891663-Pyramimonas_sp.AAC.1